MNKRNEELYKEMFEVATNRRTAKQYDPENNVDKETLEKIFAFAKTAPTSMGLELVRMISIDRDSEYKRGVNEHLKGFNQERAYMASNLTLIITKTEEFFNESNELLNERSVRMLKTISSLNNEEYVPGSEKPFLDSVLKDDHANNNDNKEEWSARQAYIHLSYILLGAATLGVETTTMEGFGKTLTPYLQESGVISKDERVSLIVAMGYVNPENERTFVGSKQIRVEDDKYVSFI